MKTIVKKTITLETKRHDFDNEFSYIEVWSNSILKDCYFAKQDYLFPDGTIKNDGIKYFFSKYTGEDIEKETKSIRWADFNWFDKLYYYDEDGEVVRWDGVKVEDITEEEEEEEEEL